MADPKVNEPVHGQNQNENHPPRRMKVWYGRVPRPKGRYTALCIREMHGRAYLHHSRNFNLKLPFAEVEALVLKTFGRVIVMPKAAADVNKMVQFLSHLGYKVEKVHNWTRSRTDADLGEKASGRASESRG